MGIVVLFALIVLFVAAVWGREAAQRLFRGGVWVAVVFFVIFAVIVGIVMANLKGPSNREIQETLAASQQGPYHVPLDISSGSQSGTVVRIDPRVAMAGQYQQPAPLAPVPVYAPPPVTAPQYANSAPVQVVGGKPHFGIGYAPVNGYIRVTDVYPGSPAYDAGIIPGMGILVIDGQKVSGVDDVWQAQNQRHHIGDTVAFIVGDLNGTTHAVNIRLGSDAEPWGVNINR